MIKRKIQKMSNEEFKKEVSRLQMLEQSFQNIVSQRIQVQEEKEEIKNALESIEASEEAYQIIGNILVKREKEKLIQELRAQLKKIEAQIDVLKKNEAQLKEKIAVIRNNALSLLKKKNSGGQNGERT